jgi:hypothetical protein
MKTMSRKAAAVVVVVMMAVAVASVILAFAPLVQAERVVMAPTQTSVAQMELDLIGNMPDFVPVQLNASESVLYWLFGVGASPSFASTLPLNVAGYACRVSVSGSKYTMLTIGKGSVDPVQISLRSLNLRLEQGTFSYMNLTFDFTNSGSEPLTLSAFSGLGMFTSATHVSPGETIHFAGMNYEVNQSAVGGYLPVAIYGHSDNVGSPSGFYVFTYLQLETA